MRHQIHYRRFLLMLVMLSAATFALAQTANDYWLAADKALAAGDTDRTFYYDKKYVKMHCFWNKKCGLVHGSSII